MASGSRAPETSARSDEPIAFVKPPDPRFVSDLQCDLPHCSLLPGQGQTQVSRPRALPDLAAVKPQDLRQNDRTCTSQPGFKEIREGWLQRLWQDTHRLDTLQSNRRLHAQRVLYLGKRVRVLHEIPDLGFGCVSNDSGLVGHVRRWFSFCPELPIYVDLDALTSIPRLAASR